MVTPEITAQHKNTHRNGSGRDRNPLWVDIIIYTILFLLAVITLYPILNVLAKSLSAAHAVVKNPIMLIPKDFTLQAYSYLFRTSALMNSFVLTATVTLTGTSLHLVIVMLSAYGLSKIEMPGYKILKYIVIIPMLFGAGLIPTYMLMRSLRLIDNPIILVITSLVSTSNILLVRNYIWSAIPESLEEAAKIEGANDIRILFKVIVPLSMPIIATISLFVAVGYWNDMFTALIYMNDNKYWPLQLILRSIIINRDMSKMGSFSNVNSSGDRFVVTPENIKAAAIIFSIVPVMAIYPFIQKNFVKGITVGAIKG